MYLRKTKKSIKRPLSAAITALILFLPANFTHAQTAGSIDFTVNSSGNWQYTSPYEDPRLFSAFLTSDGRGSMREGTESFDTGIPTSVAMEVLIADTPDGLFVNHCNTPKFTGDTIDDLSCFAAAASDQGFAYVMGESTPIPPPVKLPSLPAPCVCPKA